MIPPIRFFWSKILPISYDNYLSETEILEFMRHRLDQVIIEINKIEQYINDQLEDDIKGVADAEIKEYHENTLLPLLQELKKELLEEDGKLREMLTELQDAMEACCLRMDKRIDELDKKVEQYGQVVANLQKDIEDILTKVAAMVKDLQNQVDFNKSWMEKSLKLAESKWLRMLNNQYTVIKEWCRDYFDHLATESLYVVNPVTGKWELLNEVLQSMFEFTTGGLTAYEFRMLGLTCQQFRDLGLTAYEFRVYGIHGVYGTATQAGAKYYDLYGRISDQPLSSVWGVFGHGFDADMDKWDITAEQYRALSDKITEYNLNKWGRYYLSNHGKAVLKDTVHLTADTITVTEFGVQEISGILKLDEDNGLVDTQELLQDISLEHLVHDAKVEVVGWSDGLYSLAINQFTIVDGGIAFNGYVNNGCRQFTDTGAVPCTLMIDVTALTSTLELEEVTQ